MSSRSSKLTSNGPGNYPLCGVPMKFDGGTKYHWNGHYRGDDGAVAITQWEWESKMREHTNRHYLTGSMLKEIVDLNGEVTLYVGGLPINISDLAKRGWSCRITHNLHGGRTRVAFTSADTRSTITFRMGGSYGYLTFIEIFRAVSQDDMNGVITKNSKPIVYERKLTELETLEQVHNNIKNRLRGYRAAHPRKVKPAVIERAIAMSAA